MSTPSPVVIEAAITPLRWGVPAQTVDDMVREADRCIAAGAGIVHYHHDMRLAAPEATEALVATGAGIQGAHPETLTYTDYLNGKRAQDVHAHLRPMAEAGVLTMFAIDPGITTFAAFDDEGIPTRTHTGGLRFDEAHEMIQFSNEVGVPISLGVFEPGHLRWILAYEERAGFSPGTIVKLYFGGRHLADQPDAAGINFGLPPTEPALDVYLSMMEGSRLPWIVSLYGDAVLDSPLARAAMERGGHVRVGAEDAAGQSQLSNADMVAAAVALAEEVGRPVATGGGALAALTTAAR